MFPFGSSALLPHLAQAADLEDAPVNFRERCRGTLMQCDSLFFSFCTVLEAAKRVICFKIEYNDEERCGRVPCLRLWLFFPFSFHYNRTLDKFYLFTVLLLYHMSWPLLLLDDHYRNAYGPTDAFKFPFFYTGFHAVWFQLRKDIYYFWNECVAPFG